MGALEVRGWGEAFSLGAEARADEEGAGEAADGLIEEEGGMGAKGCAVESDALDAALGAVSAGYAGGSGLVRREEGARPAVDGEAGGVCWAGDAEGRRGAEEAFGAGGFVDGVGGMGGVGDEEARGDGDGAGAEGFKGAATEGLSSKKRGAC